MPPRMSELVDLLEVPAVAARFGIAPESLPQLTQWMAGAGIKPGTTYGTSDDFGFNVAEHPVVVVAVPLSPRRVTVTPA